MNSPRKITDLFVENVDQPKLPIDSEVLAEGENFVAKVEQISEIPNLDFSKNSKVFILVPVFRELKNIKRLFSSWNSQILSEGTTLEIVILINQKTDNHEDTEENQQTLETLQNLYKQNKKPNIKLIKRLFFIVFILYTKEYIMSNAKGNV
jgi:hypothetical protein